MISGIMRRKNVRQSQYLCFPERNVIENKDFVKKENKDPEEGFFTAISTLL